MTTIRFAACATLLLAALCFAAEKAKVADIVKSPEKFDAKIVEVTGIVAEFQQKTSRAGNKYVLLKLKDGDETVNVYQRGELKPPLKEGEKVRVQGLFRKEKKLQNFTVKNEIDATPGNDEKDKKNGIFKVK